MNPMKLFAMSGGVPVLDWTGPEFLGFYVVCYVAALGWSFWHRRRRFNRFSAPHADVRSLVDPYEAAYLAGGARRCAQLAVVRSLERGDLEWKPAKWGGSALVVKGPSHPGMNEIESRLHEAAVSRRSGLPLSEVGEIVAPLLSGIESRLAVMGLRPTGSERAEAKTGAVLPFILLLIVGGVKLLIGLDREKPVVLLVICMAITLFTVIGVMNSRRFLTPAGESLLKDLREQDRLAGNRNSEDLSRTVALTGVGAAFGFGHVLAMDEGMRKELTAMSHSPASGGGGSGCSSGCSSGCGGGGDGGGCGGCGGD